MMGKDNIPVIEPYNPLDKRNLGASVAATMLAAPIHSLPPEPFIGAGVYAIYYRGDFAPYRRLAELNRDSYKVPIYVGKAVPAGARKGGLGMNVDHGLALYNSWIPLAESMLIEEYKPLWNRCIDGFGNHDPGKGRYQQQKSPWDCIHQGREWADKLKPNATSIEDLLEKVARYLDEYYN